MFSGLPGITETKVGYIGGKSDSPSYVSVCAGDGHTEALQVQYDPSQISYEQLLVAFFNNHQSEYEMKAQYKSALFPVTEEQRQRAVLFLEDQKGAATTIEVPAQQFWEGEWYHQNYNQKQKVQFAVIALIVLLPIITSAVLPASMTKQVDIVQSGLSYVLMATIAPQLIETILGFGRTVLSRVAK